LTSRLDFHKTKMSDLDSIKTDIEVTKADLANARRAGDRDMILALNYTLTEQQKKENLLLAAQGKLSIQSPF